MSGRNAYADRVFNELQARVPWEKEFLQAVDEVLTSLAPVLDTDRRYEGERILERMVEPERVLSFKVPWTNDRNEIEVNRGYRVQFNSALGPYKGGLRFHSQVNLASLKFLGFEQTFKNALTGISMGGGKGGSDFQFRGRSDREIMRFCQSFMTELYRFIGPDVDVPAGDIGVGARELGYLFGHYKRLVGAFRAGTLTGKGSSWGGSNLRPEATGWGLVYFTDEVLKTKDQSLEGKTVAVSGFGNVAWGTAIKVDQLGGKVVTLSGPDGMIYDPDGVTGDKIDYMLEMRLGGQDLVKLYADEFGVEYREGKRPWEVPCDVALPCAIQNELDENDAENLIKNGCKYVLEGANMPTTPEAIEKLQAAGVVYVPGKASNAGGVGVSGLEMAQNGMGLQWTRERVDEELQQIMKKVHTTCVEAASKYGHEGDYLFGANVGGFLKVADAMMDQGIV